MKLQHLLESINPLPLLLHIQQLIIDEYARADVELGMDNVRAHEVYRLEVKYCDLKPVIINIWKESNRWIYQIKSSAGDSIYPSTLQQLQSALSFFEAIKIMLKANFELSVIFENDCRAFIESNSALANWVDAEIGALFKYLDSGRLKKAADVHVVIDNSVDEESSQALETRYNSMIVNYKKLNDGREVYILANLE